MTRHESGIDSLILCSKKFLTWSNTRLICCLNSQCLKGLQYHWNSFWLKSFIWISIKHHIGYNLHTRYSHQVVSVAWVKPIANTLQELGQGWIIFAELVDLYMTEKTFPGKWSFLVIIIQIFVKKSFCNSPVDWAFVLFGQVHKQDFRCLWRLWFWFYSWSRMSLQTIQEFGPVCWLHGVRGLQISWYKYDSTRALLAALDYLSFEWYVRARSQNLCNFMQNWHCRFNDILRNERVGYSPPFHSGKQNINYTLQSIQHG